MPPMAYPCLLLIRARPDIIMPHSVTTSSLHAHFNCFPMGSTLVSQFARLMAERAHALQMLPDMCMLWCHLMVPMFCPIVVWLCVPPQHELHLTGRGRPRGLLQVRENLFPCLGVWVFVHHNSRIGSSWVHLWWHVLYSSSDTPYRCNFLTSCNDAFSWGLLFVVPLFDT